MRPVRHVRVVARVLYDDGLGPGSAAFHLAPLDLEKDASLLPLLREPHLDALLRLPREEGQRGGFGRRCSAGPGGPTGPELLVPDPRHARGHGRLAQLPVRGHLSPPPLARPGGTCGRTAGCRDGNGCRPPPSRGPPTPQAGT